MNKDPKTYKGLPMCISRLRKKIKTKTNGDNIFIAVRNHGYYLKPLIAISN
nr:MAG TPA: DNA-binding response regulator [Caudoviricetes sp.]